MNKKLLAIIGAIAVLIISGIAYLMIQGDDVKDRAKESAAVESTPPASEEQPDQTPAEPQEAAPQPAGQYVQKDYNESLLVTTDNRRILFFYAPWCSQCRALEADILAKGVPPGVTIFKVDYDTNQDLRNKYDVRTTTTLVEVDSAGNFIKDYVAYHEPTLENVEKNLLQ